MSEQPRLFDSDRYAPTTAAVVQRLPESNARAFWLASQLGRWLDQSGSSQRLKSAKEASGTLVNKRNLPIILTALGDLGPGQWRKYTKDWERRYLAHKCGTGTWFLFARPLLAECPACHAEIPVTHVAPSPKVNRGPGFAVKNMRNAHVETGVTRTSDDAATHVGSVQERTSLRTEAPHHPVGLTRDEVGTSSAVLQEVPLPAVAQNPARTCSRCLHQHFPAGSRTCRTCDCEEAA